MAEVPFHRGIGRLLAAFLVIFLAGPTGCGRKSPPVPPGTLKPRPPQGLEYAITKDGVVISWDVPTKNVDGSPIFGLKGFEVFRAEESPGEFCDQCPKQFESPIWIPFKGKLRNGLRMSYEDHTVKEGYRYTYAIRTVKGLFSKSALSEKLTLFWHPPPGKPAKLEWDRRADAIVLRWTPPKAFIDGTPLTDKDRKNTFYKVLRRVKGEEEWRLVAGHVKGHTLKDRTTFRGMDYEYRVVPIFKYHGVLIPGEGAEVTTLVKWSPPVTRQPQHLVALRSKDGIELRWEGRIGKDEGFRVYRMGPSGLADALNKRPIREHWFKDTTLLPKGTYTYWVTIVRGGPVESEGPPSNIAVVKVE